MTELVKFLLRHAAIGFALAGLFVFVIVKEDLGGLGTLAAQSDSGTFALLLLAFMMGVTFASAQMGFAVMLSAEPDDDEGEKGKRERLPSPLLLQQARVMVKAPRPRR